MPASETSSLPRYDLTRTYAWNYEHAPQSLPAQIASIPAVPAAWDYCGLPVGSPLGIAAGPLLNGRWVLYYASLGFDVLTYKTVRSAARACYDLPNLQPIREQRIGDVADDDAVTTADEMRGSWAVSFGMPSRDPSVWRADVEATRRALPSDKVLSVSVVASPEPDWTLEQLAEDYAACAREAADAGADCVEANFSCPNVQSCDGQLYQQPDLAGVVAARVRRAMPPAVPLAVKIGHITDERLASELLAAVAPQVQALVMVNCMTARVLSPDGGAPLFGGHRRGIAGRAILDACVAQAALFAQLIESQRLPTRLVGVGGIATAADVRRFLDAGCRSVQLATAAMLDPSVGIAIRRALA
jgi:dihydroorotate dehydrogenase